MNHILEIHENEEKVFAILGDINKGIYRVEIAMDPEHPESHRRKMAYYKLFRSLAEWTMSNIETP